MSNPKLPLTPNEKAKLRKAKLKISEIHTQRVEQLIEILNVPNERAKELLGLAEFQLVPSIGHKLAEKLVYQLNIFSMEEIKNKNGAKLLDKLEKRLGVWTDSCVEDQIRCVVSYANAPNPDVQWFDFTEERKRYREKVGYPEDRPVKAWYE
ncbi:helix-hairpin-helix domain-containing protein [Virgibacillus doumboii]|uniref:helix-hairpin-helix domain-containing protein n=1 Tax=Virgibacillus doumboii TaxID=2697503 RepID=UPI0013DF7DBD|nr:helix-hairpin-helix domain-containing protein [Virgibacillus doumboii]